MLGGTEIDEEIDSNDFPGSSGSPSDEEDRTTLVGLLFETASGVRRVIAPGLDDELGVGGQSFDILIRLFRTPGNALRMSDLAAQTLLTPSGLSRATNRLELAGLVERVACPGDRRGAFATLTDLGLARTKEALARHRSEVGRLFDEILTEDEEATLARLLRRVRDRVHPQAARVTRPGEMINDAFGR